MKKQFIPLFHIVYWCFYIAMLVMVIMVAQIGQFIIQQISYFITIGFSFVILPSILGFYLSYIVLFKKYLESRSFSKLLWSSLLGIILITTISCVTISSIFGTEFMFKSDDSFLTEAIIIAFIAFINGIIGFILKGFLSWYDGLKLKEQLQKHTHKIELELIKSKLDPHFLFNSINNIDAMMIRDVDLASQYLDKLSTILRFMLYESKGDKIPLKKELAYVQRYIDLQKIRTTNNNFVNYVVEGPDENCLIEPMLFIPFIENAFKHVGAKKAFHAIDIKISNTKNKITFICKNNYNRTALNKDKGIGNDLIEKRLQLLYPNQYTLTRSITDQTYSVQLIINVNEA